MSDPNDIVTVTVSTILAPAANTLQQTGAILSYGGSTVPVGSTQILTRFGDLAQWVIPADGVVNAVWAAGVVTVTLQNPIPGTWTNGDLVSMNFTGFTPTGYNGTYICTITGADTVTYNQLIDPTIMMQAGKSQFTAAMDLNAKVATFFRQGTGRYVYILELGFQTTPQQEMLQLENWLNVNPLSFYGYLVPYAWGNSNNITNAITLFEQFVNPEAMTYFWITLQANTVGLIPNTCKSVVQLIEDPSVYPARISAAPGMYAEYTIAGMFYWALQFQATSVTRVAPMCFKYIYGVTPYNQLSAGSIFASFKTNNVNYIRTGAEGGINYTFVYMGVTADGMDYFNWWWTIDWVQINIKLDLANAIINGTNNPLAPLYYDQPGINQLEAVLAGTMKRGGGFGMINGVVVQTQLNSDDLMTAIDAGTYEGQCNVNAVPFLAYSEQNPSDYGVGEYDGLSTLFIPARGFVHVLVSVVATDIVTL
jgi:hypothetical protein